MTQKNIIRTLFASLLLVVLWWLFMPANKQQEIKYYTQPLSVGSIESTVNSSGSISPVVTVDVGSELSGLISELNVDFNDQVTKGQTIARIDDRTVQSRLKQSQADLASAKASLVQLQTALARAEAEAALANRELARARKMSQSSMIGEAELDTIETNYQLRRVDVDAAKASILVGESNVLQSESSLEQVILDLDRTYIRSPVDGVVIDRQVDTGQTVSASLSAPTLFSIAQDLEKMQIEADVDEADIGRIRQGQTVKFTVDAFPDKKFQGIVAQVRKAATVTSNVVTYKVIISVENKELSLLPGMTANIDIILGQRDDVLRASNSALRFTPDGDIAQSSSTNGLAKAKQLGQELELNPKQVEQLGSVLNDMQNAIQALREQSAAGGPVSGGPPSDTRQQMRKIRSQMQTQLQGFLSPEQIDKYQALAELQRPTRNAQANISDANYQRGTVWILKDGQPHPVNVRVGISDLEYSEILSRELKDGQQVIVRAQKVNQ